MFHNTEEFLNNYQELIHISTNKSNSTVTEEECRMLNLIQEWKTVKIKTSNINKVEENTKTISCENRFSVLSFCNEVNKSYDKIYEKNFNYWYLQKKLTSTKLRINNIKHRHSKDRRSKRRRIISESHGRKLREYFIVWYWRFVKKCTQTNVHSYIPFRYDIPELIRTIRFINFKLKCLKNKYEHLIQRHIQRHLFFLIHFFIYL